MNARGDIDSSLRTSRHQYIELNVGLCTLLFLVICLYLYIYMQLYI